MYLQTLRANAEKNANAYARTIDINIGRDKSLQSVYYRAIKNEGVYSVLVTS